MYSISRTNTLVLKIHLYCVVILAASIWVFNTSPTKPEGSDFLLFIFQQLKEIWVKGKRFHFYAERRAVKFNVSKPP